MVKLSPCNFTRHRMTCCWMHRRMQLRLALSCDIRCGAGRRARYTTALPTAYRLVLLSFATQSASFRVLADMSILQIGSTSMHCTCLTCLSMCLWGPKKVPRNAYFHAVAFAVFSVDYQTAWFVNGCLTFWRHLCIAEGRHVTPQQLNYLQCTRPICRHKLLVADVVSRATAKHD